LAGLGLTFVTIQADDFPALCEEKARRGHGIDRSSKGHARWAGVPARLLTSAWSRARPMAPALWLGAACLAHALVVGAAWWDVSGGLLLGGEAGGVAVALGRLAGLCLSSAVLLQLVLVSRLPRLEPSLGCDRLYRLHRRLGYAIGSLLPGHPFLLTLGYARRDHLSIGRQFAEIAREWPYAWAAIAAIVVIVAAVVLSTPFIRGRLTYEAWHLTHLALYLAVGLASLHQPYGAEPSSQPWRAGYWVAVHVLVIGCFVVFRAGRPIFRFVRHRFRIEKVVRESADVMSVYLAGRRLHRFTFRPGQYANVAFLSKGRRAPHPFSFSAAPNGQFLRLSVKAVGDFTRRIHELAPGTSVVVEGPLGAFTANEAIHAKYLMLAGGIGITPIRALTESLATANRDIVLLYSARTADDLVFVSELRALTARCHFVVSRSADAADGYEHGRVDEAMITRLVPDVHDREVFLCGPLPMMKAVTAALTALQVRRSRIHYEQFV
jgi:predicted ferric reductase